jgi:hypothetical protein
LVWESPRVVFIKDSASAIKAGCVVLSWIAEGVRSRFFAGESAAIIIGF